MKKFEVGKTYNSRSICDSECIFKITIISRTEKTAQIQGFSNKRAKIYVDSDGNESIQPEHYSMAPIFRAESIIEYKFEVGQKVIFTNDNGVNWGEKTITKLDTRSGRPTYYIEPTDTPWYSVPESNLTAIE